MKVRFWGVRGSTPTPTPDNFRYGGNTSCVEVRTPGGQILIFDCGTGLRMLGKHLLAEFGHRSIEAYIFLTHFHWDHIQGIPFFEPLYNPENRFTFLSFPLQARRVEESLQDQMSHPYFPVDMSVMQAHRDFRALEQDTLALGDAVLNTIPLNHPQGCLGYRLECGGKVLVYATDNEPGSPQHDRNVRTLAEGADVLIYDAQYTPLEYASLKKGWGHSTWREAVNIAQEAHVQQLILFHHDPDHNDNFLDSILAETTRVFPNSLAAWEGLEMDLALDEHKNPQDRGERRFGNRHFAQVPLKVQGRRSDGTTFHEQTVLENLSVQGAYFVLENEPDPRIPMEVEFSLFPGQQPRILKSHLVRSRPVQIKDKVRQGIAVLFR